MSDTIQTITRRIFKSFEFHLDRNPEKGLQQIQEISRSSFTTSTYDVSLGAVGSTARPQRANDSALGYAATLHRLIYNRGVSDKGRVKPDKESVDNGSYLLASALLFAKLQDPSITCDKVWSAVSSVRVSSDEDDPEGFGNFLMLLIDPIFQYGNDDKQIQFGKLREGAQRGGEASCREFLQNYRTQQARQAWAQTVQTIKGCIDRNPTGATCLKSK